jgi:hypothetical protein
MGDLESGDVRHLERLADSRSRWGDLEWPRRSFTARSPFLATAGVPFSIARPSAITTDRAFM